MEALSYCQLMERCLAAEARIAELESQPVTVKLPSGTGWASDPYNHGGNDGISECAKELRAAGINVEAE